MNTLSIQLGHWLFQHCFPVYHPLYTQFKNHQDRHEIRLLKQLIQPGFHILDIGANIGYYTRQLSQLATAQGHVYAFEPDITNFRHLQKNTKDLKNVTLWNAAVSDQTTLLKIYRSKLLNVDHRTYPIENPDSIDTIQAICIDEWLQAGHIPRIDLIKMDIQGYELVACKGMQSWLQQPGTRAPILAEYWPYGLRQAGASAVEWFDFLTGYGYQFAQIQPGQLMPLTREWALQHAQEPFEFSVNVLISPAQTTP